MLKQQKLYFIVGLIAAVLLLSFKCKSQKQTLEASTNKIKTQQLMSEPTITKTAAEWRKILTDEEYHVLREAGTERPFTGKYTDLKDDGNYYCKACGNLLFTSGTKFHSGCGWPSFYDNAGSSSVDTRMDYSFGMTRIEVLCKKCHSHLGHVFDDGPKNKTGLRYCINSISLDFKNK